MRRFIAISLLALGLVGCNRSPQTGNGGALQIWRSPDSSLQQRTDAVTKPIPPGTSKENVERVLGKQGMWTHYHGLTLDAINNRQLPDHDYWRHVYEFPGGGVSLEFAPATAWGDRFVRASPFRKLMSAPVTNTP